jgi:hypothetical protein
LVFGSRIDTDFYLNELSKFWGTLYAAVSVEVGGFLGIGDKEVVMELNQLRREGDAIMTDLTKEQIKALQSRDD